MPKQIFIVLFLTVLCSCGLTDNFDEEPMFLDISEANFSGFQGLSPTHKIQDVWVYANGFNIGVFELPAKVPVLGEAQLDINILPGIRNNGQNFSSTDYPFYKRIDLIEDFVPGKVITVDPEITYVDQVKFGLNEDFETANEFFDDVDGDPASTFGRSEDALYGSFCGKITVTEETSRFIQATSTFYKTEVFQSSEVYLELDYKAEVDFIIGYIGYKGSQRSPISFITLFDKEEWSKVYLDLSVDLNGGEFDSYQIMIAGSGLQEAGSIWVDNVRIVHI